MVFIGVKLESHLSGGFSHHPVVERFFDGNDSSILNDDLGFGKPMFVIHQNCFFGFFGDTVPINLETHQTSRAKLGVSESQPEIVQFIIGIHSVGRSDTHTSILQHHRSSCKQIEHLF